MYLCACSTCTVVLNKLDIYHEGHKINYTRTFLIVSINAKFFDLYLSIVYSSGFQSFGDLGENSNLTSSRENSHSSNKQKTLKSARKYSDLTFSLDRKGITRPKFKQNFQHIC